MYSVLVHQDREQRPGCSSSLASPFASRGSCCCQRPKFPEQLSPSPTTDTSQTPPLYLANPLNPSTSSSLRAASLRHNPRETRITPITLRPACLLYDFPRTASTPSSTRCLAFISLYLLRPRQSLPYHRADTFTVAQDPQKEECQEGYPVLPDGLRRLRNRCVFAALHLHPNVYLTEYLQIRPDYVCKHSLRKQSSPPQRVRRPYHCTLGGGRQDPTRHSRYAALLLSPMARQSLTWHRHQQNSMRKAPVSRSQSSIHPVSVTRSTTRPGKADIPLTCISPLTWA